MDTEGIRAVLAAALVLRPPKFEQDTPARSKVSLLEDSMMSGAYAHADLEEAHHYLTHSIEQLREKIEQLDGYEVALPKKAQDRITQADITRAKRVIAPELFDAGKDAKLLLESVKRQIDRFEWEQGVLSRAYTAISGG